MVEAMARNFESLFDQETILSNLFGRFTAMVASINKPEDGENDYNRMYAFGGKWRERKRRRKLQRKAKEEHRQIIIPDEAFYADPQTLPRFDEVKIQEELSSFYDPSSFALASEYARFKYSMGGNIKMYDDHIALSSPKRKIKKSSYSPYKYGVSYERSKLDSSGETAGDLFNESMDLNEKDTKLAGHGDDLDFGTAHLRASFENLDISSMPENVIRASETRSSRKGAFETEKEENRSSYLDRLKDRDYSPIRSDTPRDGEAEKAVLERHGSDSKRDYSPVRNISQPVAETRKRETRIQSIESATAKQEMTTKAPDTKTSSSKFTNTKADAWKKDANKQGDVKVFESMTRYDRTLNYVNQQNETLQNGVYNEVDLDLSDLSSDVFTDNELPMAHPSALSQERLDKDFYPDSPTSEFAFSKTPCSSRKNSIESLLSDDSAGEEDVKITKSTKLPLKVISISKTNGMANGSSPRVTPKGGPLRNGKVPNSGGKKPEPKIVKNAESTNTLNKSGGGRGKITSKKLDYSNAKAKVNSFGNIRHIPGGGQGKIQSRPLNNYKSVEPRTDTHGVEAYSNLPAEFQEIARRLARQDKDLRDHLSNSGSSSGGRSRPRSRLSSRSSRGGSLSPERTPLKATAPLKGMNLGLSASAFSLSSVSATKKRRPINRVPSLHSRPHTPSLSRSHPATYCTPHDSRSRPHSRPTSRSSSPVRSRNSSPTRGTRSRTSSPNRGRVSRNASPARGRHSRSSSPSRNNSSRKSSTDSGKGQRGRSREKSLSGRPSSRSSSRNRLSESRPSTPVMDINSLSARSVFQVIPVSR